MGSGLAEACGSSHSVFIVGKGGVGKTTSAGALAVALADGGERVRLISTDPAHSLGDLFGVAALLPEVVSPCGERLVLEAFDARAYAERWTARIRPRLAGILEAGTYLDGQDVAGVLDLSLPGIDELMAALRLAELAGGGERVVVDTAPTGHTLRLLEAADLIDTWLVPLRAMAAKGATIASQITGTPLRLSDESALDELETAAARFRSLLHDATFLVVERGEPAVRAETDRLLEALAERRLRVGAVLHVGGGRARAGPKVIHMPAMRAAAEEPCTLLRELAVFVDSAPDDGHEVASGEAAPPLAPRNDARVFLRGLRPRILLFAGKGGVGKSTCAAAAAIGLAETRPVLLVSTDPAGSLRDVLAAEVGPEATVVAERLMARQIDAAALLHTARERYRSEIRGIFERLGLDHAAAMDRAVIESFWNLAPPGADEVMALIELTDAAGADSAVVVDASPTGHFVRLLEMPELVGQWTRALLRILARYRTAAGLDEPTARVLAFAKQLRLLKTMLSDAETTGVFLVTLAPPLVHAETQRLRDALDAAGTPVAACIVNRADARSALRSRALARDAALFAAPELVVGPRGTEPLTAFLNRWERIA